MADRVRRARNAPAGDMMHRLAFVIPSLLEIAPDSGQIGDRLRRFDESPEEARTPRTAV